jgi:hypothetical protein
MATTGLFQASIGARGTATSGKQEIAQQREGDMANYHYMDGLLRTLRHAGRCLVNMIPHYYNKERFPLILVHTKSILAGLILIWLSSTKFEFKNPIIAAIGAAIIGLHIFQWYDENKFISSSMMETC